MVMAFNTIGIVFFLIGLSSCSMAKSALHESNGLVAMLIGVASFVGAALIDELRKLRAPPIDPEQFKGPGDKIKQASKLPWLRPPSQR